MNKPRVDLELLAKQMMEERGLEPEFSVEELLQLSQINHPASPPSPCTDLRSLLWCSIDNDDSRDLDQLSYAEKAEDNKAIVWVAIADVDALIQKNSAIDLHAQTNTTSVYTPAKIFSMLPEKLSTNLTSLNENEDRIALVAKIMINQKGEIQNSSFLQAIVHNYAKLTYNAIGGWLEGTTNLPDKVHQIPGLEKALKCQHEIAQILKQRRHDLGSLTLDPSKVEAKLIHHQEILLEISPHNFAHQLIEEFMIATNFAIASHFREAKIASLRRVVRVPKRWSRIVEIAKKLGEHLPDQPDSKALDDFLIKRKAQDPQSFADLSLTVIKLLGRGEYIVENTKDSPVGHFGLALPNYTHSTAPNRRFPDLISQRQYKAYLRNEQGPYSVEELHWLADHCTQQEDAATKVERQITKSAAAMFLSSQIGAVFQGIVTGTDYEHGTWVRIFHPPVEGKITKGFENLDVGDKVSVKLMCVNIPKGYIDFKVH